MANQKMPGKTQNKKTPIFQNLQETKITKKNRSKTKNITKIEKYTTKEEKKKPKKTWIKAQ